MLWLCCLSDDYLMITLFLFCRNKNHVHHQAHVIIHHQAHVIIIAAQVGHQEKQKYRIYH